MELTINNKLVEGPQGATILEICRQNRIPVPTLCQHEAVEPFGACRLCMVQISHPSWGDWTGMVAACLYPIREGLVVETNSPAVREIRKTVVDLLLAQAPAAKPVQALAKSFGLTKSSFPVRDPANTCILCGLCTRVCERMGTNAIATQGRGAAKYIGTPFDTEPEDCIGCLSCAHICPTGHIGFDETAFSRKIWGRTFELLRCQSCGRSLITTAQRDHLVTRHKLRPSYFELCDQCKRPAVAKQLSTVGKQ